MKKKENWLVFWLDRLEWVAKTKKEVVAIVEEVIASKGNQIHLSNGWWEGFRHRQPCLSLRTVEKLSYARSIANDVESN